MGTYETALTHAFDKAQTKATHTPTDDMVLIDRRPIRV